ncbi:MAG: hypothetical protein V1896_00120 [Candidatus Zambryskibacteria bacterium]
MENKKSFKLSIPVSIIIAGAMLSGAWMYNNWVNLPSTQQKTIVARNKALQAQKTELEERVLPSGGVELPATWGDLGKKLISAGVIDERVFRDVYAGQFTDEYEKFLSENNEGKIKITEDNAGYLLNLFWALGLSNGNVILNDPREMRNPQYGGAAGFASTGGWTVAVGSAMDHYNRHIFFELTPEQQTMVDKISRGIYRPCCGNSTHFPDCNHGMAMLGLLELMASQGASEQDMWKAALAVNSYWFPDTYLTLATYMEGKGIEWKDVNPQEILGINYSSNSGFSKIASQVSTPTQTGGGSGCDVGAERLAPVEQRQQSGCGI